MSLSELDAAHDPGGKVRLPLQPGVIGDVCFSACGRYRHWLSRSWGEPDAPFALWIGMNPSTAEAAVDDPTIRREMEFTKRLGLTRYVKCNVMDYRATNPKALGTAACSHLNATHTRSWMPGADIIIACWGRLPPHLRAQALDVERWGFPLHCLGVNQDGSPKHPLYVKGDTLLKRFGRP